MDTSPENTQEVEGQSANRVTVASSVSPKRKKPYKTKSDVWGHFTKVKKEGGSLSDKATCNYCVRPFSCPSSQGTSTLRRHLEKCNKYPYSNKDPTQKVINYSTIGESQSAYVNWKFDQEFCRTELASMIIIDELPFSFVEKEGFRRFMRAAQPRFNIVSRTTITKDCTKIYLEERMKLKSLLETSTSGVCITTDLWTSIQNLGYMCLTAHFIDKNWKLHKRIINFRVLPTPHRGEAIAQAVETCLLRWVIQKVCTITVHNASSNDVAVLNLRRKLIKRDGILFDGECFHVRCFAHILNLIVRDGINEVKESISNLRECVKYVRSSPGRLQLFRKCADEMRVVSKRLLCLDVQTHWNSTYLMVGAALEFEKVFERFEEQDPGFVSELRESAMSEEDWMKMRSLHLFLEHFFVVTKRVSGSLYVTSNNYFHEVYGIQSLLFKWSNSENDFFHRMTTKMQDKFDKYCSIDKVNKFLIIAVVLDPCYKLKYVKFCYSKFYSSDKVDEIIGKVRRLMDRLYQCYLNWDTSSSGVAVDTTKEIRDSNLDSSQPSSLVLDENKKDWRKFLQTEEMEVVRSELDRYLEEAVEDEVPHFDILQWWKTKSSTYRILSQLARNLLAIPISTVASESAFSTGGRVLDQFRSSLTPKLVESLVCAQDWLRSSSKPVDIEEKLEDLEEIESGIADDIGAGSVSFSESIGQS